MISGVIINHWLYWVNAITFSNSNSNQCSVNCGIGKRTRIVKCSRFKDCPRATKPHQLETCMKPCWKSANNSLIYQWHSSSWSKCSSDCGFGVRSRTVQCLAMFLNRDYHYNVSNAYCRYHAGTKPIAQTICYDSPCPSRWLAGEWSECSSKCGFGSQHRLSTCYSPIAGKATMNPYYKKVFKPGHCNEQEKPANFRQCKAMNECGNDSATDGYIGWHVSPWSKCSAQCSFGIKRRIVTCVEFLPGKFHRVLPELMCRNMNITKPNDEIDCFERNCIARSCRHAAKIFNNFTDNKFLLELAHSRLRNVQSHRFKVDTYCRGMDTQSLPAQEYLDLSHPFT